MVVVLKMVGGWFVCSDVFFWPAGFINGQAGCAFPVMLLGTRDLFSTTLIHKLPSAGRAGCAVPGNDGRCLGVLGGLAGMVGQNGR